MDNPDLTILNEIIFPIYPVPKPYETIRINGLLHLISRPQLVQYSGFFKTYFEGPFAKENLTLDHPHVTNEAIQVVLALCHDTFPPSKYREDPYSCFWTAPCHVVVWLLDFWDVPRRQEVYRQFLRDHNPWFYEKNTYALVYPFGADTLNSNFFLEYLPDVISLPELRSKLPRDLVDLYEHETLLPFLSGHSKYSYASLPEFKVRLDVFSEGLLRNVTWEHVAVAGGSVPLLLQTGDSEEWGNSDIDLFLYDCTPEECVQVAERVMTELQMSGQEILFYQRRGCILGLVRGGKRNIQIVMRECSLEDTLNMFDQSMVKLAWDGTSIQVTPEALATLADRKVTVTRNPLPVNRALKVIDRGCTLLPGNYEIVGEKHYTIQDTVDEEKLVEMRTDKHYLRYAQKFLYITDEDPHRVELLVRGIFDPDYRGPIQKVREAGDGLLDYATEQQPFANLDFEKDRNGDWVKLRNKKGKQMFFRGTFRVDRWKIYDEKVKIRCHMTSALAGLLDLNSHRWQKPDYLYLTVYPTPDGYPIFFSGKQYHNGDPTAREVTVIFNITLNGNHVLGKVQKMVGVADGPKIGDRSGEEEEEDDEEGVAPVMAIPPYSYPSDRPVRMQARRQAL